MQYKTTTFNLVHFLIEQCLALNLHKMDTFKKKSKRKTRIVGTKTIQNIPVCQSMQYDNTCNIDRGQSVKR